MDDLLNCLRLWYTVQHKPLSFRFLVENYKTYHDALGYLDKMGQKIVDEPEVLKEMNAVHDFGGHFITHKDPRYSHIYNKYCDAVPVFSCVGNRELLSENLYGFIGSRSPTQEGLDFCPKICNNLTTISGMALGIDAEVHRSSQNTVAVIPGGLNVIYPKQHQVLYQYIKTYGLIISIEPFDAPVQLHKFFNRNKFIAMLCTNLTVMESTVDSGSAFTAKYAYRINKPLFAVPGHPLNYNYSGNLEFLTQGMAQLLTKQADLLQTVANDPKHHDFQGVQKHLIHQIQGAATFDLYNLPNHITLGTLAYMELHHNLIYTPTSMIQNIPSFISLPNDE